MNDNSIIKSGINYELKYVASLYTTFWTIEEIVNRIPGDHILETSYDDYTITANKVLFSYEDHRQTEHLGSHLQRHIDAKEIVICGRAPKSFLLYLHIWSLKTWPTSTMQKPQDNCLSYILIYICTHPSFKPYNFFCINYIRTFSP